MSKHRSWVWTHFGLDHDDPSIRKCNFEGCSYRANRGTSASTTAMAFHLTSAHKLLQPGPDKSSSNIQAFLCKRRSEEEWLVRQVCLDGISMNVLAKSEFQAVAFAALDMKHPKSPTSVSNIVNEFIEKKKEEVKIGMRKLVDEGVRLSIITDEWTSIVGPRYLNVIISSNKETFNLGLERCRGSLTSDRILDLIKKKLDHFDIDLSTIVGLASDGCNVMIKVGKMMATEHQLCLAHCLNLCVKDLMYISKEEYDDDRTEIEEDPEEDDLSEGFILSNNPDDEVVLDLTGEYEGVVRKVRAIVKFFKYDKRNCVLQDKLNQVQAENRLAIREMRLQLDCPTRWNTILAMLRSVLKEPMQTVLAELCELFEPVLVGLTEEEWILAKSLFEGLLPLEVLTKKLSEAHCSLLEAEYLFLSTIDIMRSLKTRFAEKLTAILITRYQQRRNVELISVLSFLANPLDYDQGTPEFPKLEMYELRNKVEQLNDRLFPTSESTSESTSEHVPVASDAAPATSSNTTEDFAISVALKLAKRMKLWKEKSVNTDNKKIIQEELRLASVTGELPDNLKKLETALLSIPASSVDCERAFSTAGRFCTKIRNRLSARSLDNFCFARAYLRKIDSQESQEFQI